MEHTYGLGTLNYADKEATGSNWQLKSLLEFSQEEHDQCVQACLTLDTYKRDAQQFQIIIWNYEDYSNLLDKYLNEYVQKNFQLWAQRSPDLNLNRCLMNFLSSVRSYLDYVETNVKRKYGNSSSNVTKFKRYCSKAYDSSFSYRFLYRFRNYAQHCGLPLTRVNYNAKNEGLDPKETRYTFEANVDRNELLNKKFRL